MRLCEPLVSPDKLRGYLLNPQHDRGRHKCRVFEARGFDRREPTILERALVWHFFEGEQSAIVTPFGLKIEIRGALQCPDQNRASFMIVSVWMVKAGERHPRLVTVRPQQS